VRWAGQPSNFSDNNSRLNRPKVPSSVDVSVHSKRTLCFPHIMMHVFNATLIYHMTKPLMTFMPNRWLLVPISDGGRMYGQPLILSCFGIDCAYMHSPHPNMGSWTSAILPPEYRQYTLIMVYINIGGYIRFGGGHFVTRSIA